MGDRVVMRVVLMIERLKKFGWVNIKTGASQRSKKVSVPPGTVPERWNPSPVTCKALAGLHEDGEQQLP